MENHILSIGYATRKTVHFSICAKSSSWAIKVAIKALLKWKTVEASEMLTWLSALSTPLNLSYVHGSGWPPIVHVGHQVRCTFRAPSPAPGEGAEQELFTPQPTNQPQVEVNSIILDISRGVLVQKSTTHQFFYKETHDVLIDQVIIRTCFDAFSCAFQKKDGS